MRKLLLTWMAGAMALGAQTFDPKLPAPVPAVTGDVVEAFGLRWIDFKIGDGAPALPGQEYTVHYTGWLRDGTKFDSSVDRGTPFKFTQGRRQVIAGYEYGFVGMKVGGKRRIFIPYQLAYGEQGRPPIPPKAELIFDEELLAVKDVPPAPAPGVDFSMPLHELEDHVMTLAKAVPAEKYDWRPAPGVRSFREVFLHIAAGIHLQLDISRGSLTGDALQKRVDETTKAALAPKSKEEVLASLTESFAALHQTLDRLRATTLTRSVDFFGTQTTTHGVLIEVETHIAEHLGQAIAYARMNGIVPPWSQ